MSAFRNTAGDNGEAEFDSLDVPVILSNCEPPGQRGDDTPATWPSMLSGRWFSEP